MSTTLEREDIKKGVYLFAVHGDLDAAGGLAVKDEFETYVAENPARCIVDLSDVSYMSSYGLRVLLSVAKILQEGGGELHLAARGKDYVRGLDVPVDDVELLRPHERKGPVADDLERLGRRDDPLAPQAVEEGLALYELHHDVRNALVHPDVVDLDYVRVHQPRRRARLPEEAGQRLPVGIRVLVQDLQGYHAVERELLGLVDHCHRAAADAFDYAAAADRAADEGIMLGTQG